MAKNTRHERAFSVRPFIDFPRARASGARRYDGHEHRVADRSMSPLKPDRARAIPVDIQNETVSGRRSTRVSVVNEVPANVP